MIDVHLPKTKFNCESCNFRTNIEIFFKRHNKLEHPNIVNVFICSVCTLKCYNENALEQHMKHKHKNWNKKPRFPCLKCKITYSKNIDLLDHMKTCLNSKEPQLICDVCQRRYHTKSKLRSHMSYHVRIEGGPVRCEFKGCNKFVRRLNRHMISHSKAITYDCEYCTAKYGHDKNLKMHQEIEHFGYRYFCVFPHCKLEYVSKRNVQLHMRRSHIVDSETLKELEAKLREQLPHIDKEKVLSLRKRNSNHKLYDERRYDK